MPMPYLQTRPTRLSKPSATMVFMIAIGPASVQRQKFWKSAPISQPVPGVGAKRQNHHGPRCRARIQLAAQFACRIGSGRRVRWISMHAIRSRSVCPQERARRPASRIGRSPSPKSVPLLGRMCVLQADEEVAQGRRQVLPECEDALQETHSTGGSQDENTPTFRGSENPAADRPVAERGPQLLRHPPDSVREVMHPLFDGLLHQELSVLRPILGDEIVVDGQVRILQVRVALQVEPVERGSAQCDRPQNRPWLPAR